MSQPPNPPKSPETQKHKNRNGGWLRLEIATRLSPRDKHERELVGETLTLDEFVDRVIARKRAQHHPRPGQKVARPASIPKWGRPLCGAKTRKGTPCQAPAVWDKENNRPRNGRCRMHGGLSTGPKTPEGKAKALSKLKNYKGGV